MREKEFWEKLGRELCDNLNWNVCLDIINDVNDGLKKPDKDYIRCLNKIHRYKTRENYFKRFRFPEWLVRL